MHPRHLCYNCGDHFENHAGAGNPCCPEGRCPSGKFPQWPRRPVRDQVKAGALWSERIMKFWNKRNTTFRPV